MQPFPQLLTLKDIGFCEEIPETGRTFEENALIKARTLASQGYIAIGDDSGLCVEALGGAPGIYSARYAGEHGNDEKNNQKLLEELDATGDKARRASFVCVIACAAPDGRAFTVRGECFGYIAKTPAGQGGFGYDPLFHPGNDTRSFAQYTPAEKNAVSHRGRALSALAARLPVFLAGKE